MVRWTVNDSASRSKTPDDSEFVQIRLPKALNLAR
ncbi:hypothetical protein N234_33500 [Ralstonia pickettii DTP0602]|nr:hypothetical protein N234_33500 [Ralstonia pickettii DTP0602]